MKKLKNLPHEQIQGDEPGGLGPEHDGLPASLDSDVEGHGAKSEDRFLPGMPGTGGDLLHRPINGGELDGNDVEGHLLGHTKGERFLPGLPGTGGDKIAVEVDPESMH